jgi:8-oxo-dGTP diphosphatase
MKIRVETPEAIQKGIFIKHLADCVILTQDNKILMQQRPENWRTFPGALNIFGGHVENGESIIEALIRELHEETGARVDASEVVLLGAISEEETNYSELVHVYFWHDKQGTITGCYEAEERRFTSVEEALSHPKIMDYARWALLEAKARGLLK